MLKDLVYSLIHILLKLSERFELAGVRRLILYILYTLHNFALLSALLSDCVMYTGAVHVFDRLKIYFDVTLMEQWLRCRWLKRI